ncbi:MAG: DUF2828 family protein [Promethearchaeota archaeon]|nr:MAG: DUF2828 family protein [Candidatus Lokiarchaeota archaeon]
MDQEKKPKKKNALLDGLEKYQNLNLTENLAKTYKSTLDPVLDLFALGGALRSRASESIISLFSKAFHTDKELTLKCLFYIRDIRGGLGERRTFRILFEFLSRNYPRLAKKNIDNVPFFGRWDDLYATVGSDIEDDVFKYMHTQLQQDLKSEFPTLLAKWLKSENASNKKTKELAKLTMKHFKMSPRRYRKTLSKLRKQIGIVERKMCSQKWEDINYESIPSKAGMIYRDAFKRHDPEGYNEYLNRVEKGEAKINVDTLYPYEILRQAREHEKEIRALNLMWENLPDYTQDEENAIIVADTSGSMTGLGWGRYIRPVEPILIAISLAIYFGERNKGVFENKFITFSRNPDLQTIIGGNLREKYINLEKTNWDMNTNIQAVFDLILGVAIQNKVPPSDMINKIYIISDMEFDRAVYDNRLMNFELIKKKYTQSSYKMPTLVFWNVDSRQNNVPVKADETGVLLVSGASPIIFKMMENNLLDPVSFMLSVLTSERYSRVML